MKQYQELAWEVQSTDFTYSGDFFAHIPADQDRDEYAMIDIELTGYINPAEKQTWDYEGNDPYAEDMSAFIPGTKTNLWDLLTKKAQKYLADLYVTTICDRDQADREAAREYWAESRSER